MCKYLRVAKEPSHVIDVNIQGGEEVIKADIKLLQEREDDIETVLGERKEDFLRGYEVRIGGMKNRVK